MPTEPKVIEVQKLWSTGQQEEAMTRAAKWLQNHPHDIKMYATLGNFLTLAQQFPEAKAIFEAGLTFERTDADLQYGLANLYYQEGDYQPALSIFGTIQDAAFKMDSLWMQAQCFAALGEHQKAIAFMLTVVGQTQTEQADRAGFIADQFLALGDFKRAAGYYDQALEDESRAIWWFNRGVCAFTLNQASAQAYFAQAKTTDEKLYQQKLKQLHEIEEFIKQGGN